MEASKLLGVYFYLHTNGNIISRSKFVVDDDGPEKYFDSDFVVKWWPVETQEDRVNMFMDIKKNYPGLMSEEALRVRAKMWGITSADYFRHAVKKAAEEEK